jgi:hypothetical protein
MQIEWTSTRQQDYRKIFDNISDNSKFIRIVIRLAVLQKSVDLM